MAAEAREAEGGYWRERSRPAESRRAACTSTESRRRSGSGCPWRTCTACRSCRNGAGPTSSLPRRCRHPPPSRRPARRPHRPLLRSPGSRRRHPPRRRPQPPPLSRSPPRSPRSPSPLAAASSPPAVPPTGGRPHHRPEIARSSFPCPGAPSRSAPWARSRRPPGATRPQGGRCRPYGSSIARAPSLLDLGGDLGGAVSRRTRGDRSRDARARPARRRRDGRQGDRRERNQLRPSHASSLLHHD